MGLQASFLPVRVCVKGREGPAQSPIKTGTQAKQSLFPLKERMCVTSKMHRVCG